MLDSGFSRDLFMGFIKLHILHHASREEVFGLEMIQELARHGYTMSPGTLYPLLHKMEKMEYLCSRTEVVHGKRRKYYRTTQEGNKALRAGHRQALELIEELQEKEKRG